MKALAAALIFSVALVVDVLADHWFASAEAANWDTQTGIIALISGLFFVKEMFTNDDNR